MRPLVSSLVPAPRVLTSLFVALILTSAACGGGGEDVAEGQTVDDFSTGTAPGDSDESGSASTTSVVPLPPTTRGVPEPVTVEPIPDPIDPVYVLNGEPAYRGVLAQLDPDRYVVQPVALPPPDLGEGIAPLTGLPLADPTVADRPAILVKIDNTTKGRPQEALNLADLVYEEQIEGGFTRLAVVYHTNDPLLGPVRSGRTTDIALVGSLNTPIFAFSGANRVHGALLRRQPIVDLGAQTRGEYFRASGRPGTYDLMVESAELWEIEAEEGLGGPPPPHFEYRTVAVGLPESAEPASYLTVKFPGARGEWDWDGTAWLRTQDGTEHLDASGQRVAAANVIVAFVDHVSSGSRDLAGSPVYEEQFIGQGDALVFTDGHVVEATWTKASLRSVPTYTTADGVPIALAPGLTWVVLAPPDSAEYS
jgi:hypothetical protein